MSEKITKISDKSFDSLVIIPRKPTVVFFSADWSGPSPMVRSILETAAGKYRSKAVIYEMDVDENPIIPTAYAVRSIPTILLFANGQLVDREIGANSPDKLEEKIGKIAASGELYKNVAAFSRKFAASFGGIFGA